MEELPKASLNEFESEDEKWERTVAMRLKENEQQEESEQ